MKIPAVVFGGRVNISSYLGAEREEASYI